MLQGENGQAHMCQSTKEPSAPPVLRIGLPTRPPAAPQFLSEHPHLLTAEGSLALRSKLRLFASWRLPPPLCPVLLARCPGLLKESDAQMQVGGAGRGVCQGAWCRLGVER